MAFGGGVFQIKKTQNLYPNIISKTTRLLHSQRGELYILILCYFIFHWLAKLILNLYFVIICSFRVTTVLFKAKC